MQVPSLTQKFHHDTYPAIDPTRPEVSAAGKNVLITGGGTGIGAAITRAFAKADAANIIILARRKEPLESVKASIESTANNKSKIYIFSVDISNEENMKDVFEEIVKSIGKIDILVANAAYLNTPTLVKDLSVDDFWRGFEVNVKGLLITCQAFLRSAVENPTFIMISSGAGLVRYFGPTSGYATSKVAGMRLMDYLAGDNPNVHVYTLHPGIVESDMSVKSGMETKGDLDKGTTPVLISGTDPFSSPANNYSAAELPGHFCVWLASPEAVFLRSKIVWTNWDVEEMKAKKDEISKDPEFLTLGYQGFYGLSHIATIQMG
ncbi:hypothetical protein MMC15_000264 [Xylographa vitiligo]|nr:hypothetical protein [Xylographa vitiligo]